MQVDLLRFVELETETKGNSRHRDTTERDVSQLHVKKEGRPFWMKPWQKVIIHNQLCQQEVKALKPFIINWRGILLIGGIDAE